MYGTVPKPFHGGGTVYGNPCGLPCSYILRKPPPSEAQDYIQEIQAKSLSVRIFDFKGKPF